MLKHKKNRSLQSTLRFTASGDMNVKVCQQNDNQIEQCIRHMQQQQQKRIRSLVYIKDKFYFIKLRLFAFLGIIKTGKYAIKIMQILSWKIIHSRNYFLSDYFIKITLFILLLISKMRISSYPEANYLPTEFAVK